MAIAFDAGSKSTEQTSTTNFTFSHTCTGSDLCLVVTVSSSANGASSATYNGVSMTAVGAATSLNGVYVRHFYLANPATGSNTVSISFGSAAGVAYGFAGSFTGVDQTTPIDATSTGSTGTAKTGMGDSVTTVADNSMVVGGIVRADARPLTLTTGTNHQTTSGTGAGAQGYILKATAGAQVIDWSVSSGPNKDWAAQSFSLAEAGAGNTVVDQNSAVALTMATNAADVNAEAIVDATEVSLTMATNAADVNAEAIVDATEVALTMTGQQADVNAETIVDQTAPVSLTMSGQTAEVSLGVIVNQASPVSLTMATNQADVNAETIVDANEASLTMATNQADVNAERSIDASEVALTMSTNQADVNAEAIVDASEVALTMVTNAADVNASTIVEAAEVALTMTANPASIVVGGDVTVEQVSPVSLTMAANAADVNASVIVEATEVALTMTAHSATISFVEAAEESTGGGSTKSARDTELERQRAYNRAQRAKIASETQETRKVKKKKIIKIDLKKQIKVSEQDKKWVQEVIDRPFELPGGGYDNELRKRDAAARMQAQAQMDQAIHEYQAYQQLLSDEDETVAQLLIEMMM